MHFWCFNMYFSLFVQMFTGNWNFNLKLSEIMTDALRSLKIKKLLCIYAPKVRRCKHALQIISVFSLRVFSKKSMFQLTPHHIVI